MSKKIKMQFIDFRFKQTFLRLIVFLSLISVYSMSPFFGLILTVIAVGYYLLFYIRDHRGYRQRQLASEVIEAYPNAPGEQLRQVYRSLFGRQLRFDAAQYLFMGAYAALWTLILIKAEAYNAWGIGEIGILIAWIIAGGLLLAGIVLFVLSFFPGIIEGTEKKPVPVLEEYIEKRTGIEILTQRAARPDLRTLGRALCNANLTSAPDKGMALTDAKASDWGVGMKIFLIVIRIFIDIVVAVWIIMCLAREGGYYVAGFIVFSFFVLLKYFWGNAQKGGFYLIKKNGAGKSMRKLIKSSVMIQDTLLSTLPSPIDATALEFCFDKTGTIKAACNLHDYQKLRNASGMEAFLLRDEKRVYWVGFLKETVDALAESAEAETEAAETIDAPTVAAAIVEPQAAFAQSSPESSPVKLPCKIDIPVMLAEGKFPTNEQIHDAAIVRLSEIDPAVKKMWKSEIDECYELTSAGKILNGTSAEKNRISMLMSQSLAHKKGPAKYEGVGNGGLFFMDKQLTEKGNLTREQIMAESKIKVPFKTYLPLIIAIALIIIAVPVLALIQRETGVDLTWASVLISTVSGIVSMTFAGLLINTHRTKKNYEKLQKAYMEPEFWQAKIDIEAYTIFEKEAYAANKARDGK